MLDHTVREDWFARNTYRAYREKSFCRKIIRGSKPAVLPHHRLFFRTGCAGGPLAQKSIESLVMSVSSDYI